MLSVAKDGHASKQVNGKTVGTCWTQLHPTPTAARAACLTCILTCVGIQGPLDSRYNAVFMLDMCPQLIAMSWALLAKAAIKEASKVGNHLRLVSAKGEREANRSCRD